MSEITCPHCPARPLLVEGALAFCEECRRAYSAGPGWVDAVGQSNYYWGELDRETMQRLIGVEGSINQAIVNVIHGCERGLKHYLRQYVFSPNRAAWKFLLPLEPGSTILDIGCGLGALSMSLSEHAAKMIVADIVPERVKLTVRRIQEARRASVKGIVTSGWPHLPLPDSSVDLVVVNGVLEWIPAGVAGDPESVQQAFLDEVGRILKPTGQLYLGIENRYGASYFRGKHEEHTRLRFISLLPRLLGRLYHRVVKKAPYRTYTHGRRKLSSMLHMSGFTKVDFYCPYPDYREFSNVVALDDDVWMKKAFAPRSWKGKLANWVVLRTGLLKRLTNSFGVVAHRGNVRDSYVQRLLRQMINMGQLPEGIRVLGYHVRSTGSISVLAGVHTPAVLISLPLDARASTRLQRDMTLASSIRMLPGMDAPDLGIVPDRPVPFEGGIVALAPIVNGHRLDSLVGSPLAGGTDSVWAWLTRFHQRTVRVAAGQRHAMLPSEMEEALTRLDRATNGNISRILHRCEGRKIHLSAVHGDFHAGNIFIAGDGAIERVVDWDLAELSGLPLWDALTFLLHQHLEAGTSWRAAFTILFNLCLPSVAPHHRLSRYIHDIGLGPVDIVLAMITLPVVHLHAKLLYTEEHGDAIIDGAVKTLDTGRVQLLEAVLTGWAD